MLEQQNAQQSTVHAVSREVRHKPTYSAENTAPATTNPDTGQGNNNSNIQVADQASRTRDRVTTVGTATKGINVQPKTRYATTAESRAISNVSV